MPSDCSFKHFFGRRVQWAVDNDRLGMKTSVSLGATKAKLSLWKPRGDNNSSPGDRDNNITLQ